MRQYNRRNRKRTWEERFKNKIIFLEKFPTMDFLRRKRVVTEYKEKENIRKLREALKKNLKKIDTDFETMSRGTLVLAVCVYNSGNYCATRNGCGILFDPHQAEQVINSYGEIRLKCPNCGNETKTKAEKCHIDIAVKFHNDNYIWEDSEYKRERENPPNNHEPVSA
jgi:hypothetical protein